MQHRIGKKAERQNAFASGFLFCSLGGIPSIGNPKRTHDIKTANNVIQNQFL